ncbi:MAG: flagellar export chaperone FliS [Clostridiaceae bacterium]
MNNSAVAYNAYKNNSINYASKEQLLLMLVDGAVRYVKQGKDAIINKDMGKAHIALIKCQDIFSELMISLDTSNNQWADNLYMVYAFIKEKLVEANLKKNIDVIDDIIPLIEEIRNTWYAAYKASIGSR